MPATSLPRLQLTLEHITECYFPQIEYDNCTLSIARALYASAFLGPQYHIRSGRLPGELVIDTAQVHAPVTDFSTNLTGRSCPAPGMIIPVLKSLTMMWNVGQYQIQPVALPAALRHIVSGAGFKLSARAVSFDACKQAEPLGGQHHQLGCHCPPSCWPAAAVGSVNVTMVNSSFICVDPPHLSASSRPSLPYWVVLVVVLGTLIVLLACALGVAVYVLLRQRRQRSRYCPQTPRNSLEGQNSEPSQSLMLKGCTSSDSAGSFPSGSKRPRVSAAMATPRSSGCSCLGRISFKGGCNTMAGKLFKYGQQQQRLQASAALCAQTRFTGFSADSVPHGSQKAPLPHCRSGGSAAAQQSTPIACRPPLLRCQRLCHPLPGHLASHPSPRPGCGACGRTLGACWAPASKLAPATSQKTSSL